MAESDTLPSDPSSDSGTPDREAVPEPDNPPPAAGTARASASSDAAPDETAGAGSPLQGEPAELPGPSAAPPPRAGAPGAPAARAAAVERDRIAAQRKRGAWEARRRKSIEARATVEEKLRTAGELAQSAQGVTGYRKAGALLNHVRASLGGERPDSPGQILIGPDRRACWDRWRQVRDAWKAAYDRQQDDDHQALATSVAEVTECARGGDPREALRRVKELQVRLGQACLRRGQFEELRQGLSEAWQAAQARITAQRQERSKVRDEWRTRREGHLARWRGTLDQQRGHREHLLQQVARLEGMEKNARSEEFAAQARGWLQETAEKLRRTETSIADLEERIRTTAKQLGGSSGRARTDDGNDSPPPGPPGGPQGEAPPGPPGA